MSLNVNIQDTLDPGSLIIAYDRNSTNFIAVPQSALVTNVQDALEAETVPAYQQNYTVSSNPFTCNVVTLAPGLPNRDVLLVMTPQASASGTIVMPTSPDNNQIVQINMTSVTNMTVSFDGNGASLFVGKTTPLNLMTGTFQYFSSINQWRMINAVVP